VFHQFQSNLNKQKRIFFYLEQQIITLSTYYTILKIEYELFKSVINPVVHKLKLYKYGAVTENY
jgi:hypothetical protein